MHCIWCHMKITPSVSWSNLFWSEKIERLCEVCIKGLSTIQEKHCLKCSKSNIENICNDCNAWKNEHDDVLDKNISVYSYDEQIKEMIAKWKYRGDYELGFAFEREFLKKFTQTFKKELNSYVIVPIPLSEEREIERCFNQASMLAHFLDSKVLTPLSRTHSEKQSKKTRAERLLAENPFILHEPIKKTVILVDDIYTTGTTIRHAATLLKSKGTPNVFSYTLVRG